MTRLLLIGPPGSGKGTQAARLAQSYGVPAISTGDIFRANVRNGTELGLLAKAYMDSGEYVPDSLTNDIVRARLSKPDAAHGFLLDGYPRTTDQVLELDNLLTAKNARLNAVIQLVADTEAVVARILKRAAAQGRSDDSEEVIRHRLDLYASQTAPLLEVYRSRGLVVEIDAIGEVDEVTQRIMTSLAEGDLTCTGDGDDESVA
ncbi:MAG: adenylate kinase [Microbacteriaceae bacterium]